MNRAEAALRSMFVSDGYCCKICGKTQLECRLWNMGRDDWRCEEHGGMDARARSFTGTIAAYHRDMYTISVPDAPIEHQTMFVHGSEIEGSKEIGAKGTLVYRTTSRSSLWYLTESML